MTLYGIKIEETHTEHAKLKVIKTHRTQVDRKAIPGSYKPQ